MKLSELLLFSQSGGLEVTFSTGRGPRRYAFCKGGQSISPLMSLGEAFKWLDEYNERKEQHEATDD